MDVTKPRASPRETTWKVSTARKLIRTGIVLVGTTSVFAYSATVGAFARPSGIKYLEYIVYRLLWSTMYFDPGRELRPSSSTSDAYLAYMRKQKFEPLFVALPEEATGMWLGPASAENVMLYLHGGAYVNAAVGGHFQMIQNVIDAANRKGPKLKALILQYDLAPDGVYPTQTRQTAAAIHHLINSLKIPPENIILAGDSAGGHLALSLISHLVEPHPAIEAINLEGKKLLGVFLMSPWVTFSQTAPSMTSNASNDWLAKQMTRVASGEYLGTAALDQYNCPLSASEDWWKEFPAGHVAVSAGELELLVDDITSMVERIKIYNQGVKFLVAPLEVHVQPVVNITVGFQRAKSEVFFSEWVTKCLSD